MHTDYLGQFVDGYTVGGTSSLKYILTPEGRLKNSGTNSTTIWTWEYNLTDHLGNVRVVFRPGTSNTAEVMEYKNYFPFGMKMTPYLCQTVTDNKYLYNGKEQQTDFELNWYDYGARFYDPALGRWHSVDPLAEVSRRWSPYTYCYNNPLGFIDPDGMAVYKYKIDTNSGGEWVEEALKFDLKEIATKALASVGLNIKTPSESTTEKLIETNAHNEKQAEIRENIKAKTKEEVKNVADASETIGTSMQGAGYITANPPLIGAGKIVEGAGAITNALLDASEGNYWKGGVYALTSVTYGRIGKNITKMEKTGKLTSESSSILNFVTDMHSKITTTISNAFIDRKKSKQE